jgi:hypothetical protein
MTANNSQTIKKTVSDLLKDVSIRNRDIISRRFGLKTGKKETLESIGTSYNITRERVRQIEEVTLKQLQEAAASNAEVARYLSLARDILSENSGVIAEGDLFKAFSGQDTDTVNNASLVFLLTLSGELKRVSDNEEFRPFWALNESVLTSFKNTVNGLQNVLKKTSHVIPESDFNYLAQKTAVSSFSPAGKPLTELEIRSAMAISKGLARNIFNEVGLASWSEIKPKGVRDKAYLVLKKIQKPQHFGDIAKLINTAGFNNKKANTQTVHNELIKDERFILVGRGLYALSEWGYKSGTVKDVLVDILRNSSKPLPKATLLAKVKDARIVKENTILLNLQDSKTFVKNSDGTYTLR